MKFKPKYIVILTGLFCSVVAGDTLHFYSCFSVIFWPGLIFWYDHIGLWPGGAKTETKFTETCLNSIFIIGYNNLQNIVYCILFYKRTYT